MKKISIHKMIEAMSGCLYNEAYLEKGYVGSVTHDSRKVNKGAMYFAIEGERVDGHDYIQTAFEQGCLIAVAQNKEKIPKDKPVVLVLDTIKALGDLARFYRSQFDIPFVGVTGSVGKTSTKEMIASILGQKYKVHKTSGNYNNNIGMPLTLLQLEESHEVAVIEMGMDRFGEIDYLSNILHPTYGVITNIGFSHIEFLGSREGILKAKTEMLSYVAKEGKILFNGDDKLLMSVAPMYGDKVGTFGDADHCDCRVLDIRCTGNHQEISFVTKNHTYHVEVDYPGAHILYNGLAGVLIGEGLGLSKEQIIKGIASYQGAQMRLQRIDVGCDVSIIDDAYNASVESMDSGLKTLKIMEREERRSIAILGSMFEMGSFSKEAHLMVGQAVAKYNPSLTLITGDEAKGIYEGALVSGYDNDRIYYFEDQQDLIVHLQDEIKQGDLILLKASRGMHFEKIREYIIGRFK